MKNKLAFVLVAVLVSAGFVAGNAVADTLAYANQAPEGMVEEFIKRDDNKILQTCRRADKVAENQ